MAEAHPAHRRVAFFICALFAVAAVMIDGARLDALASSAAASLEPAGAAVAPAGVRLDGSAKPDRKHGLRFVSEYVESIDVSAPMTLSEIRTVLHHLDRFTSTVLTSGTFRHDPRPAEAVWRVAQKISKAAQQLGRLGAKLKSEGEVDDGGAVLPSERNNICNALNGYDHFADFRGELKALCRALDDVRAAVRAGKDEEAAVLDVNDRLQRLKTSKEYELPGVAYAIASLLAEEWRWVTKRLAKRRTKPRPAVKFKSSGGDNIGTAHLSVWMDDPVLRVDMDPESRAVRLQAARILVDGIRPEKHDSLSAARNAMLVLELCQDLAADLITCKDWDVRERIRILLRDVEHKLQVLRVVAEKREAAGDIDDVNELPVSERNNICKHLEAHDLAPQWRAQVKSVCDSLDRMRKMVLAGREPEPVVMDIVEHIRSLKSMPGYPELKFAGEIEAIFAEELRWLSGHTPSQEQSRVDVPERAP